MPEGQAWTFQEAAWSKLQKELAWPATHEAKEPIWLPSSNRCWNNSHKLALTTLVPALDLKGESFLDDFFRLEEPDPQPVMATLQNLRGLDWETLSRHTGYRRPRFAARCQRS